MVATEGRISDHPSVVRCRCEGGGASLSNADIFFVVLFLGVLLTVISTCYVKGGISGVFFCFCFFVSRIRFVSIGVLGRGGGIGKVLHIHSFLFFFSVWDCFLFIFFFPFVVHYPSLLTAMFGGTTWNTHGMDGGCAVVGGCADTLTFGIVE